MKTETLRVVWKYIRWAGQGRTPMTYCHYIIESPNHRHKLKVFYGSPIFKLLKSTRIYKDRSKAAYELLVDAVYNSGKLLYVTNFRKM